jgi:hypothetical protein
MILGLLHGVREVGDRAIACCPAHEDRSPSLSVKRVDGKVLVHCHAGCTLDDITSALGIRTGDLFDRDGRPQPERHRRARTNLRLWRDRSIGKLSAVLRRIEARSRAVGEYLAIHGADLGNPGSLDPAAHALWVEDLAWCAEAVSTLEADWWGLHSDDRDAHLAMWREAGRPYAV